MIMIAKLACRRLSTLAVVFGALLAWAEAQPLRAAEQEQSKGFVTKFRLLDASGKQKKHFKPGELIRPELSVTNETGSTQTLSEKDGGLVGFVILDGDDRQVFESLSEKNNLKLKNGQTKVFRMKWDQRNYQGQAVAAGTYRVMMFLYKSNGYLVYADPSFAPDVKFQIGKAKSSTSSKAASSTSSSSVVISGTASGNGKVGFYLRCEKRGVSKGLRLLIEISPSPGQTAYNVADALATKVSKRSGGGCTATVTTRANGDAVLQIVANGAATCQLSYTQNTKDSAQSIKIE